MSAQVSGKFQDHYSVLGVDPKSDAAAIQAAYQKLVEKFGPDNPATWDPAKLDSVSLAFEVLSDKSLRATFDKLKGIDNEDPKFSGSAFWEALNKSVHLRATLLSILYDRRRVKPFTPSISLRQIEALIHVTTEQLNFALWYLKQRSLVISDDKSSLQITVEGMDFLESHPPDPAHVLPFFKADAVAEFKSDEKKAEPAKVPPAKAEPAKSEPKKPFADVTDGRGAVMKALNRTARAQQ